ncbi:hypothetical protein X801_01239, partial [Opisthorchis viverrini]
MRPKRNDAAIDNAHNEEAPAGEDEPLNVLQSDGVETEDTDEEDNEEERFRTLSSEDDDEPESCRTYSGVERIIEPGDPEILSEKIDGQKAEEDDEVEPRDDVLGDRALRFFAAFGLEDDDQPWWAFAPLACSAERTLEGEDGCFARISCGTAPSGCSTGGTVEETSAEDDAVKRTHRNGVHLDLLKTWWHNRNSKKTSGWKYSIHLNKGDSRAASTTIFSCSGCTPSTAHSYRPQEAESTRLLKCISTPEPPADEQMLQQRTDDNSTHRRRINDLPSGCVHNAMFLGRDRLFLSRGDSGTQSSVPTTVIPRNGRDVCTIQFLGLPTFKSKQLIAEPYE